jgi:hypothetical protein
VEFETPSHLGSKQIKWRSRQKRPIPPYAIFFCSHVFFVGRNETAATFFGSHPPLQAHSDITSKPREPEPKQFKCKQHRIGVAKRGLFRSTATAQSSPLCSGDLRSERVLGQVPLRFATGIINTGTIGSHCLPNCCHSERQRRILETEFKILRSSG